MGWKKIQAKFMAESAEIYRQLGQFLTEAEDINRRILLAQKIVDDAADEIQKIDERSSAEAEKIMASVKTAASNLDTQGIDELDHAKRTLLLSIKLRAPFPKPLDLREVQSLFHNWKSQAFARQAAEQNLYIEKLAASWPKVITAGMTFKNKSGALAEVRSGPHPVRGHIGDEGLSYEVEVYRNADAFNHGHAERVHMTKAELSAQKGWKYVRT